MAGLCSHFPGSSDGFLLQVLLFGCALSWTCAEEKSLRKRTSVYAAELAARVAERCTDTSQRRVPSWWGQEGSQGWKCFVSHQANPCIDLSPCPVFLRISSSVKDHGEGASPKHLSCFYVGVSGSTKVGKDYGGAAYKNTLEVSAHTGLLIPLGLEKHLVIRLKQLNWVL